MGGGDLNLKKSWHPMLMSNQKKVWEEEQRALAERKKIDQMMKERAEERNLQELQELQESAGGKKRQQRVDWMYSGPSSGQAGTTEEMEGYLLGKRRIDGLIKGTENQKLEKSAKEDSFMAVQNANNLRDTASKIREDPMLAIKKQEQAAYEAMMNDPVRRKMLLKAAGQSEEPERERKRRKHHHRHRDDHERRHRDKSTQHRDDQTGRVERQRYRRHRSYSRSSDERSRSPAYRSKRSPSPRRQRSYSPDERRDKRNTSRSRSRSRSPYRPARAARSEQDLRRRSWHTSTRNGRGRFRSQSRSRSRSRSPPRTSHGEKQNDAAARLAAMQQDANDLDEQRQRRLKEIELRDATEAERLDKERAQNARYGGRASFVNRMHQKAGDISLGERIGRSGHSRRGGED